MFLYSRWLSPHRELLFLGLVRSTPSYVEGVRASLCMLLLLPPCHPSCRHALTQTLVNLDRSTVQCFLECAVMQVCEP